MIYRNYDGLVTRWFGCVERGHHTFNNSDTCIQCGAPRPGPAVKIVRGGVQYPARKR